MKHYLWTLFDAFMELMPGYRASLIEETPGRVDHIILLDRGPGNRVPIGAILIEIEPSALKEEGLSFEFKEAKIRIVIRVPFPGNAGEVHSQVFSGSIHERWALVKNASTALNQRLNIKDCP